MSRTSFDENILSTHGLSPAEFAAYEADMAEIYREEREAEARMDALDARAEMAFD